MKQPTKFRTHTQVSHSFPICPFLLRVVSHPKAGPILFHIPKQTPNNIQSSCSCCCEYREEPGKKKKKEEGERGRPGWWRYMGCCVVGEWPSSFSRNGEAVPLDAECVCVCAGESERRAEGGGVGGGEGRARAQQQKRLQHYTTLVSVLPTY